MLTDLTAPRFCSLTDQEPLSLLLLPPPRTYAPSEPSGQAAQEPLTDCCLESTGPSVSRALWSREKRERKAQQKIRMIIITTPGVVTGCALHI